MNWNPGGMLFDSCLNPEGILVSAIINYLDRLGEIGIKNVLLKINIRNTDSQCVESSRWPWQMKSTEGVNSDRGIYLDLGLRKLILHVQYELNTESNEMFSWAVESWVISSQNSCSLRSSNDDFIGSRIFVDVIRTSKWNHPGFRMGPGSKDWCLLREKKGWCGHR